MPPEDFGRLFSSLWMIEEELAIRSNTAGSGMYVTSVNYNSPLQLDITLVKLPKGAVEAIFKFFTDLLFYEQVAKLKDAEAAERAERVRAMKIENAMRVVRLAHGLKGISDDAAQSAAEEIIEAGDQILDSPLRLEQAHAQPPATQKAARKRISRKK
jgi:tyrosyl-tRNA synthetase